MNGLAVRVPQPRGGNGAGTAESAPTDSGSLFAGKVAGAVLAAARRSVELTQEQFAERLCAAPATVQGWEQGTRPLLNVPLGKIGHIRRTLATSGVASGLMSTWESALRVEEILADITVDDPDEHPLALVVPDRATTELLAWPVNGAMPRQLVGTTARLDVPSEQRSAVAAVLRRVAEQARGSEERPAMLRRQVRYLLGSHPESQDWITAQQAVDLRPARGIDRWSPAWPLVRSTAVTAAVTGDPDPIQQFIENGLSSDEGITANLNYWAYWVGESAVVWSSDDAMISPDTDNWAGGQLLDSLLDGVVNAPYRDLCAHTLWALLRRRRTLFTDPRRRHQLHASLTAALDNNQLAVHARHKLEQVAYTVEVTS